MDTIKLVRYRFSDTSTQGLLFVNQQFVMHTLERPWLANKRNVSCIPDGVYPLVYINKHQSHNFPYEHIAVMGVPNRSGILIHVLNYPRQTRGCIGVGLIARTDFIGNSAKALHQLVTLLSDSLQKGQMRLNITSLWKSL